MSLDVGGPRPPRAFFLEPGRGLLVGPDAVLAGETFARALGHRAVTDAHLVLVARANGGKLATFDRGLSRLFAADVTGVEP